MTETQMQKSAIIQARQDYRNRRFLKLPMTNERQAQFAYPEQNGWWHSFFTEEWNRLIQKERAYR